jgi:copper(I)-binding protein
VIRCRWAGALSHRLVLVAAVALIPALAGCEAGNNAPTLSFHYPTDAAGTAVGDLSIRNVFVLGAPLGRDLATGESASVFLALVNTGAPDKLVKITAAGTAASVTLPASGVPVVDGHPVFYSGPMAQIVLHDLTRPLRSGSDIMLTLVFQNAGPVTLQVPVMPRAAQYATLQPPLPAATQTAAAHASAQTTPTPSSGTTSTATPSASPSPG